MAKIKFSSDYPKLWGQKKAILFATKLVDGNKLHPDLIEYDTKNTNGKYYPLPKTMLIQLIFLGNKDIPFCTLRRYTHSKYKYYHDLIGQEFDIIIGDTEMSKKFKYKEQMQINHYKRLFDPSCRADLNKIKLNPSAGKRHNKRIAEICLALLHDIDTPFYTEVKFKTGYKPDIFCPLYLDGCVIEVRDSETEKETKEKEDRIPEELGSVMFIYNDATQPFKLEDIL